MNEWAIEGARLVQQVARYQINYISVQLEAKIPG